MTIFMLGANHLTEKRHLEYLPFICVRAHRKSTEQTTLSPQEKVQDLSLRQSGISITVSSDHCAYLTRLLGPPSNPSGLLNASFGWS
jgi:hypothetical protein